MMKPPTPEQFGISEQDIDALKRQREQYEKIVMWICGVIFLLLSLVYALMAAIYDPKAKHGRTGIDLGMFFAALVVALFFASPIWFILSRMFCAVSMLVFERVSRWKRNVERYERAVKDYNLYLKGAEPQKASKSGMAILIIVSLINPLMGVYFLWEWIKGLECDLCKKRVPISAHDVTRGRFGLRVMYANEVICDECWRKTGLGQRK